MAGSNLCVLWSWGARCGVVASSGGAVGRRGIQRAAATTGLATACRACGGLGSGSGWRVVWRAGGLILCARTGAPAAANQSMIGSNARTGKEAVPSRVWPQLHPTSRRPLLLASPTHQSITVRPRGKATRCKQQSAAAKKPSRTAEARAPPRRFVAGQKDCSADGKSTARPPQAHASQERCSRHRGRRPRSPRR